MNSGNGGRCDLIRLAAKTAGVASHVLHGRPAGHRAHRRHLDRFRGRSHTFQDI